MTKDCIRIKRSISSSRIDEFPHLFDDSFFYNQTLDQNKHISILRNIVYRKIKKDIIDRVTNYQLENFPLNDKFEIIFETDEYTEFQWAVIRRELLDCGFDARFTFDSKNREIRNMIVPIERKISLFETLSHREDRHINYEKRGGKHIKGLDI
jgi:hypothetical protein